MGLQKSRTQLSNRAHSKGDSHGKIDGNDNKKSCSCDAFYLQGAYCGSGTVLDIEFSQLFYEVGKLFA